MHFLMIGERRYADDLVERAASRKVAESPTVLFDEACEIAHVGERRSRKRRLDEFARDDIGVQVLQDVGESHLNNLCSHAQTTTEVRHVKLSQYLHKLLSRSGRHLNTG